MFLYCSKIRKNVTVKHVQHIEMIIWILSAWGGLTFFSGTEEVAGLWFARGVSTKADTMTLNQPTTNHRIKLLFNILKTCLKVNNLINSHQLHFFTVSHIEKADFKIASPFHLGKWKLMKILYFLLRWPPSPLLIAGI